jgi:hypothetical protein
MADNPNRAAHYELGLGGYRATWTKPSSIGTMTSIPQGSWQRPIAAVRVPRSAGLASWVRGTQPGSTLVARLHLTGSGRDVKGKAGARFGAGPPANFASCVGLRRKREERTVLEELQYTGCEGLRLAELNLRRGDGRKRGVQTWR